MAAHTEILADLTTNEIAIISHELDLILNSNVFLSLLNGAQNQLVYMFYREHGT